MLRPLTTLSESNSGDQLRSAWQFLDELSRTLAVDLSPGNPYLLAGLCTIGLMLWSRNVLLSVALSAGLFYLFRWWL